MTTPFAITFDDIVTAAKRIHGFVLRTPVVTCDRVNASVDAEVFFKCENLQHVGAFKARGACNAVLSLSDQAAAAGVVTHSSGNHAAAVARAALLRGITAHIVMPHNSAQVKIAAVRCLGVEPVFCEPDSDSRQAVADEVQRRTNATFVHPFDNADVMAGQGTAVLEFLEQVPNLDAIIVPVGGGGLLSGTLVALTETHPAVQVFAAEPQWADDAWRSVRLGSIQSPTRYDSMADGLRTRLGSLTFPIIRELVQEILLVDEVSIGRATVTMLQEVRVVAEPSGAVPLAALFTNRERFQGRRIGVIVSGGNIDPATLTQLLTSGQLL